MKKYIAIIILSLLYQASAITQTEETVKGKSQVKKIILDQGKPVQEVPILVVSDANFFDVSGNRRIDANEVNQIKFKIQNTGSADAKDVLVHIKLPEDDQVGLTFLKLHEIGTMKISEVREIVIPVTSNMEVQNGVADFEFMITEQAGFDAAPFTMQVETHQFDSPLVAVTEAIFSTDDTRGIRKGYPAKLKILIQNIGLGDAENVKVDFDLLQQNTISMMNGKDEMTIGNMKSGEVREIDFQFFPQHRMEGSSIPVKVNLSESWMKYAKDTILVAALANEADEVIAIQATEEAEDMDMASMKSESSMRGIGDPLKGIDLSSRTDMKIGEYYALIIGIDSYQMTWNPLKNAVGDAMAIESMLKSNYKFDHFRTLYNKEATRENILDELAWLIQNVGSDDNVLIYFSGHGEFKTDLNKGFWVPYDARTNKPADLVSNSVLQDYLAAIRSKHTLLVSDACFSGDILRGKTVSIPFEDTERYYRLVHERPSRQAITSGGIEPVMDGGRDGHSVFAYYLLKYLEENNRIFYDTYTLYDDIRIPIINNSRQTPEFQHLQNTGDEGGQFIFIKKEQ